MPKTIVTLLLDRSGSMKKIKAETLAGYNAYIKKLREGEDIDFSLIQFATGHRDATVNHLAPNDVPELIDADYVPKGYTPLIDAAYETILEVEHYAKATPLIPYRDDLRGEPKVVICIQTDGEENDSKSHTLAELQELIAAKTKAGWEFIFMGAGIEAYNQAGVLGITQDKTISYGIAARETMAAFTATGSNTARYSAGVLKDTGYTAWQKRSAGDTTDTAAQETVNDPKLVPPDAQPPTPTSGSS